MSRTPGSLAASVGTAPLSSISYLGLLSRISLEQGIVKLRNWKSTGPTQAHFSTDEELEPRAFNSWPEHFPLFQGGQLGSSIKMSFPPCCALVSTSLHEPGDFYPTGFF